VTTRLDRKTRWGLLFVAVGGLSLGLATGVGACVSQPTTLGTGGTGGGAGGSGGGVGGGTMDAGVVSNGKALFAALEPDMYAACGPMCHEAGGIADAPFLTGPDRYQSIISWPGIVVKDPSTSKLETVPVAGQQHPYKKLDQAPLDTTLYPQIKAWLKEEAKGIVTSAATDAGKYIDPFVPIIGFNAVYLSPLDPALTGMALTFTAFLIDDTTLELSDIEVHPTGAEGLHVVHPLFAVNPVGKSPNPDPVDSFSNVDQTFDAGQSGVLGPGTLILTDWEPEAKLSLAFEKVEVIKLAVDAGMDGGTTVTGGCKDVNSFMSNAQGPLKNNCTSCHGGGNAQAKGAIDMSSIDSDPAAACAQVKNRVNPASPGTSQLFITTDPGGNAAHPYKFGGTSSKFDAFKSSVSMWIQAEQ
jgi:hypothetical protein